MQCKIQNIGKMWKINSFQNIVLYFYFNSFILLWLISLLHGI